MDWGRGGGRKHTEMQQRIIARMKLKLLNVVGVVVVVAAIALATDAHLAARDIITISPNGGAFDLVATCVTSLEELPGDGLLSQVTPFHAVDVEVGLSDLREDEDGGPGDK